VHLRPGTRLLDVASGPGALTAEAANRGARSVGVDLSPRMIELAQRRTEVKVTEHAATYFVPDTETLWRGGLGSLVLTGAVIGSKIGRLKT
jgi:cyclopropane fatty-acyl-phospholipid synthase-like methyltransferase